MGIGCYSVDRSKSSFIRLESEISNSTCKDRTINSLISIPLVETFTDKNNIDENRDLIKSRSTETLTKNNLNHSSSYVNKLSEPNNKSKPNQKQVLPNFQYSPFSSPHVTPERKLKPDFVPALIYNGTGSLQRDTSSLSIMENSNRLTQLKQYQISQQLGQGSYGLVQLAYNCENSTYYAMKSLSKKKLMKSCGLFNRPPPIRKSTSSVSSIGNKISVPVVDPLQKIYKEIAFHKKLNHPNVVKLIEVFDDPSQEFLYMVFEYMEKGPVMQIGRDPPFSEIIAKKYLIDTLLGLEYLHHQKIVHRDIKPANLLLSKDDVIKISDFGVSNEFTGDDVYLSTTAGSPAFMAPESVQDGNHSFTGKALDIWALGITLYSFLFGKVPYENCNRYLLYQMIINNPVIYPESPSVSSDVMDLFQKMLDKNPLTRIKLPDIKVHPWITNNGLTPLISEAQNCGFSSIDVNEEDVANSIRFIPHLETMIKVKMLLKQKSFGNPLRFGSVSKLNESNIESKLYKDQNSHLLRSSSGAISPVNEDNILNKHQK